jgi:HAD superfamily hydrolase (TIGR01509 family)
MAAVQIKLACERARVEESFLMACVQRWMEQAPLPLLSRYIQPGLIEFLEACRARGLRLGVFSNYPAEAKLRALGIADYFDVALCAQAAEIGVFKPHPRGLQVTLARLGAKADESLYVGDRAEVDATAAAAAGIPCAILTRPRGQHAYNSHIEVGGYAPLLRLVLGDENVTRSSRGFNQVA